MPHILRTQAVPAHRCPVRIWVWFVLVMLYGGHGCHLPLQLCRCMTHLTCFTQALCTGRRHVDDKLHRLDFELLEAHNSCTSRMCDIFIAHTARARVTLAVPVTVLLC